MVYAIDARKGTVLWRHDPQVPKDDAKLVCCDVVIRGVALYHDKVYGGHHRRTPHRAGPAHGHTGADGADHAERRFVLHHRYFSRPLFRVPSEAQALAVWLFRSAALGDEMALDAMSTSTTIC